MPACDLCGEPDSESDLHVCVECGAVFCEECGSWCHEEDDDPNGEYFCDKCIAKYAAEAAGDKP